MEVRQITGQVVDAVGNPVSEAEVSPFWMIRDGRMEPWEGVQMDNAGGFSISVNWYRGPIALMAMDRERRNGGTAVLEEGSFDRPARLQIAPLVHLHGDFFCSELGARPEWTNVYLSLLPEKVRVAQHSSEEARFSFQMPPGRYQFWGYGTDVQDRYEEITLTVDKPDFAMGTVALEATIIARHYGQPPPEWHVTDARGVEPNIQLSDFRGKWVVLEFWADYCGPCIYQSLPSLMKFYEEHAAERDKFTILAFHKHTTGMFEKLDENLKPIIAEVWHGKTLPFPILLDSTGETIQNFGISGYPTTLFIDPEGRIAKGMDLDTLATKLKTMGA